MKCFVSFSFCQGFSKTDTATWEGMTNMWPLYCTNPPPQWKAKESEKEEAFSAHLSLKQEELMQVLFRGEAQRVAEASAVPFSDFLDLMCRSAHRQGNHHSRENKMMSRPSSHLSRWPPEVHSSLKYSVSFGRGSEGSPLIRDTTAGWWSLWSTFCYPDAQQMTQTSCALSRSLSYTRHP